MVTPEAHLFSFKLAPQPKLPNPSAKFKIRKNYAQQKQTSMSGTIAAIAECLNNLITHAKLSS